MITIRPAAERGHRDYGWLDTRHTFSFNDYHDPAHMGFRTLRVINEDRVRPGEGFGTHPHRDMEIVTWVLEGGLQHRDSMGNGSVIRPGEVQRMSAGTGITHSEFNASKTELVHFLQIWIVPSGRGLEPSYEQVNVAAADLRGQLRLVASPDGRAGSVTVHQDAELYAGTLGAGAEVVHPLPEGRHAWLQVTRGAVRLNGQALGTGDGAAVSGERRLEISAVSAVSAVSAASGGEASEVLLFSLA